MTDRKILIFVLIAILYCLYSIHVWLAKTTTDFDEQEQNPEAIIDNASNVTVNHTLTNKTEVKNTTQNVKRRIKKKVIPLFIKDACSILQIFTEKPTPWEKIKKLDMENSAVTAICLTVFLGVLAIHAVLDAIKAKEEQKAKLKLNPGGERRPSLAEFANRKYLRRESSKFGLQLFQIAESVMGSGGSTEEKEKKDRQQKKFFVRGESTNSYLSDKKSPQDLTSAPSSVLEPSNEPRLLKRQSVSKLFGGRPAALIRRSSFPALPINPELHAVMLGHRQASVDSDDEEKGRRVRLIRRY